jgi:hypothetical protein
METPCCRRKHRCQFGYEIIGFHRRLSLSGALALPLGAPIGVTVRLRFPPRSGPISMS